MTAVCWSPPPTRGALEMITRRAVSHANDAGLLVCAERDLRRSSVMHQAACFEALPGTSAGWGIVMYRDNMTPVGRYRKGSSPIFDESSTCNGVQVPYESDAVIFYIGQ